MCLIYMPSTNVSMMRHMHPRCRNANKHKCVHDADAMMQICGPAQICQWCGYSDQHKCIHDAETWSSTNAFMMRTCIPAQMCLWCGYADQHNCRNEASTLLAVGRALQLNVGLLPSPRGSRWPKSRKMFSQKPFNPAALFTSQAAKDNSGSVEANILTTLWNAATDSEAKNSFGSKVSSAKA